MFLAQLGIRAVHDGRSVMVWTCATRGRRSLSQSNPMRCQSLRSFNGAARTSATSSGAGKGPLTSSGGGGRRSVRPLRDRPPSLE